MFFLKYNEYMKKQKINIIIGPTASGKSKIAIEMAQKISGQIVNADAFQVYKDLRILTARPSEEDEKKIPHYLYGYVDCMTQENVQSWLQKISSILPTLSNPILVGGSGMYVHALVHGINEMPDIPCEIRQKVREMPLKEIRTLLKGQNILPDPQRQRRALEIFLTTGKSITYFQNKAPQKVIDADFNIILVQPEREVIYDRIEKRLKQMFDEDVVHEVQNLLNLKAKGGVLKAIGVKEITEFLKGNCSLEETQTQILLATRHYAKRQMTWFRHQIVPDEVITK